MSNYQLAVYPDVEDAVRAWLLELPEIQALVGSRVVYGIPPNATFPLIAVSDVTGSVMAGEAPVSNPFIQLDCWGNGSDKASAQAVKRAVIGAIQSLRGGTPMGSSATGLWGQVLSAPWAPDPESNQARYVVTAEFAVKAS